MVPPRLGCLRAPSSENNGQRIGCTFNISGRNLELRGEPAPKRIYGLRSSCQAIFIFEILPARLVQLTSFEERELTLKVSTTRWVIVGLGRVIIFHRNFLKLQCAFKNHFVQGVLYDRLVFYIAFIWISFANFIS